MDRKALLAMLVLSLRSNLREATAVLEELNRGGRERTFPSRLKRCFRTIEHDARAVGLDRFAGVAAAAKEASADVLRSEAAPALLDLLLRTVAEFQRAADAVEAGTRHRLDGTLARLLGRAAVAAARAPRPRA